MMRRIGWMAVPVLTVMLVVLLVVMWTVGVSAASAQTTSGWLEENQFTEADVQPPASFSLEQLLPFEVSAGSSLRFGIDPQTVTVGEDKVVRYVLVARSPRGATNVLYQGLRCDTAEFRTYAAWYAEGGWSSQKGDWARWLGSAAGLPALRLARDGFCAGRAPNTPVPQMLKALQYGKFR